MKIQYEEWSPRPETMETVEDAQRIISDYEAQGYSLTLRQLYYQFVAKNLVENSLRSYKNLGNVITKARMAGLISWEAIEDRNRDHHDFLKEESIENVLSRIHRKIQYDNWARQDTYVEVWIEKAALENVLEKPCARWAVPYMACKGYLSASEAWRAGRRFLERKEAGKDCVLIHLGDHDPSGIDMTRDNQDRLNIFAEWGVEVRRIALNMDQIKQYAPPPNFAKLTDSRASDYVRKYGRDSWELDALEPSVLDALISRTIEEYVDPVVWEQTNEEELRTRQKLIELANHWDEVEAFLGENFED